MIIIIIIIITPPLLINDAWLKDHICMVEFCDMQIVQMFTALELDHLNVISDVLHHFVLNLVQLVQSLL